MKPRYVILANEPRLLRGMLRRMLNKTPDLEVVGEVTDQALLPPLVERTGAQWVIVPFWSEGGAPHDIEDLLAKHPSVSVLGMATDGSRAKVKCAGKPERTLLDLSLDELLGTLCRRPSSLSIAQGKQGSHCTPGF